MKKLIMILLALCAPLLIAGETNTIVGTWATEPTLSQLGMSVAHYRFTTNGTFECWADFLSAKGMPTLTTRGTYELKGTNIALVSYGRTNLSSFALSEDTLLWTGADKKTVKFKREKQDTEPSDGEATSETAPSAVPEASHP
jgi:hypothetical protein